MPALHKPYKNAIFIAGAVLAVLLLSWLLTAYQLFYNVHTIPAKSADAVVMLGGASKERLTDAMLLRSELGAKYLAISYTNTPGNATADYFCDTHSHQTIAMDIVCFTPSPMDTRGEATAVGKLAAKYEWKTVTVVTSKYHIERAGRLMNQCVRAEVTMASTNPQFSTWQWLRRFAIETGGLLDVILQPQCRDTTSGVRLTS